MKTGPRRVRTRRGEHPGRARYAVAVCLALAGVVFQSASVRAQSLDQPSPLLTRPLLTQSQGQAQAEDRTRSSRSAPEALPKPIDASRLPPPAAVQIDYNRDIRPIFELTCFRCHGPERPKSGFRLDRRDAALAGGENGRDILPGKSAESPLIHYVARLVEDMEMPPPGKADPLTTNQIALLRAWIDQGAVWPEAPAPDRYEVELTPAFGWYFVEGDEARFREHHWTREDWAGGLNPFRIRERWNERTEATIEGHAGREDYKVALKLEKKDFGFVRGGFEQYRHYYDDSGGFYQPFTPPSFELDRDLSLEIGKAWIETGLTLPSWPLLVAGYEYQYKEGDKSLLQWLPVTQPANGGTRNIYPAYKSIDERTHVLRLDAGHDVAGVDLADHFRYEFYDLETSRRGVRPFPNNADGTFVNTTEGANYQQLANTFTAEKQITDWLLLSAGYLYSRLYDGGASFRQNTVDAAGNPALGNYWKGNEITLDQSSHVLNFNAQMGPWEGLTFSAGLLPEWNRQEGFGDVNLDEGLPPLVGTALRPAIIRSDNDRFSVEEQAGLRFTRIPYTVLFAEGRWQQESISQFERGAVGNPAGATDFVRDTDATDTLQDYRTGFQVSPWNRLALSAHYRHRFKDDNYDHDLDQQPVGAATGVGYSAFIRGLRMDTDEVEAKLVWRTASWLKSTFSYRIEGTDYETKTDPAPPFSPGGVVRNAGNYDGQTFGVNLVLTPVRRLYLSSTFSYTESRITTFDSASPSIVPYQGDIYSVLSSATVVLNDKTDLTASYSFSRGNYDQNNEAFGLPVGIRYDQHGLLVALKRRVSKNIVSGLQYGFFRYNEPSSGGVNDYSAHGVFATLGISLP
jgi:mono/diheme cytochrome c family protein